MKVVLFGGSGFLGSYVADELTDRKYEVVIADIKEARHINSNQQYVKCDILDRERVSNIITDDVSIVYNFAGMTDINEAINMPVRTMEMNVIGNLNILEACRGKQIERFVYASSAYAFSRKGSFYGISKHTSEKLIEEYFNQFGLKFTIVRYGSLYGERADEHNYIYNLLKSALIEHKIFVKGDGDDIREYIHAQDAARLSVDIVEDDCYINEHIVLTGFEKLKRMELFEMIREILNNKVSFEYSGKTQEGHYNVTPYAFHPNFARKLVANPFIDMGQGLVDCMKHIYSEIADKNIYSKDF